MTRPESVPENKPFLSLLGTTLLGGFIVILPAYLAILAFNKMVRGIVGLTVVFVKPIAAFLPFEKDIIATVFAWILFFLACLIAGLLLKTQVAPIIGRVLNPIFNKIPGYSLLRRILNRAVRLEKAKGEFEPAFVALGHIRESLVPAFLVEKHPNDYYSVFVPAAPTPTIGSIYLVHERYIFPVDVSLLDMIKYITRWGEGSPELLSAIAKIEAPQIEPSSGSQPEAK